MSKAVKDIQIMNFDRVAPVYKKRLGAKADYYISNSVSEILRSLKRHFGSSLKKMSGLDLGCGAGDIATAVAPYCRAMHGIDISSGMVTEASKAHKSIKNVSFSAASSDALPFPNNHFDFIVSAHAFHHLIHEDIIKSTLSEMARVTKKNGIIAVVDANSENPLVPIFQKMQQTWGVDAGNEKLLSRKYLVKRFNESGLRVINTLTYSFIPHFTPRLKFLEPHIKKSLLKNLGKDFMIIAQPLK